MSDRIEPFEVFECVCVGCVSSVSWFVGMCVCVAAVVVVLLLVGPGSRCALCSLCGRTTRPSFSCLCTFRHPGRRRVSCIPVHDICRSCVLGRSVFPIAAGLVQAVVVVLVALVPLVALVVVGLVVQVVLAVLLSVSVVVPLMVLLAPVVVVLPEVSLVLRRVQE